MIHRYQKKGLNFVLDVNSGAVHLLDDISYAVSGLLDENMGDTCPQSIIDALPDYTADEIREAYDELYELKKAGQLFAQDDYIDVSRYIPVNAPVKALCLHVAHDCNLRCRYCMPDGAKIPEHEEVLTHEEFLRLAALFAQCGIDTVRVTGGEPLVRKSVAQLVAGLKATPGIRHVSMTTNGTLLAQQLPALLDAGLDSVNISLDTLDPAVFRHITARDEFAAVQAGLRAALESPLPVKLNCVPQVGVNEGELEAIAALARDNDLQVRFIEMMPIGYGAAMPCVSGPELRARFANRWPELHPVEGTNFGNGPAVYYTVPGWKGSIGFIAAVHGKFCASCNRVRLTSQGFLRPCLASETGCDLRALLRGGADDARLRTAIRETIWSKPREHHFEDRCMPATRSMYRIGG